MVQRIGYVQKDWLRERIITMQAGGRLARRLAAIELADELLPVLRRMAIVQQRRSWLAAHSWDLADDATSHAYMVFLRKIPDLAEPYDIIPWFRVVMMNFLRDEGLRRNRVLYTDEPFLYDGESHDHTGVLSVARQVRDAIAQLTEMQQKVIYLRYWKEQTQDEIAQHFDVKRQAITGCEGRALATLRRILLKGGFVHDGWADTRTS